MKKIVEQIFSNNNINYGRQTELDIAKAMMIVCLAHIHCIIQCTPEEGLVSGIPYVFDTVIGGPLSFPMYMFAMGIGIVYSENATPANLAKRAVKLGIVGYGLNICRFLIPCLIGYAITGEQDRYIDPLVYRVLGNDIMQFAPLALALFALLIFLKVPDWIMLVLSYIMTAVGTLLNGTDIGSPLGNIFMGYFIGTEDAAGEVISDFPLLNWFVVPVCGYIFGKFLIRVKNKNKFYILISPICLAISIIYFYIGITNELGMFGEGQNCYYHISIQDVTISILAAIGLLGVYHFVGKLLGRRIKGIIKEISRNINAIYCIHWVFVIVATELVVYLISGSQELPVDITMVLATAISIVSIIIAHYYQKIKTVWRKRNEESKIAP